MLSHSSFSYSIEEDYRGSGRDMVTVEIPVGAKYYNLYFSSEISWADIKDYGTDINNPVGYETGNADIWDGRPDDAYGMSNANKGYMMHLDPKCTTNRFIYDEEPHNIDTLTAAVSGLKKQIKDSHDVSYSYETYTTTNGSYSYKIRFANTVTDKAKNLIFFDSLENYNLNGKHSDWHGFLKRFDVSQLKQMGIDPVIYVSKTADLSIDDHHDITDTSVWEKVTKDTNLSEIHAFAIDCRKTSGGKDFVLNEGESISAVVYMKAPESVDEKKGEYAKAYNNIYIQDTIMSGGTESKFFIHQDYTAIAYRVEADIRLHKQNANDANESVEGAKYKLSGKSDYGTEVNEEVTTGVQGDAVFEGVEKGTYTLKESYSPDDWLLDRTEYTVKVDGSGKITCDGKEIGEAEKIVLKDSPRIHGDISFMKYSTAGSGRPVTGAKFRLSGKSKYGNEIMMYATSDTNGKVRFGNVEYGDYKIKEVEAPEGYISVSKEYDASVSDTGFGSIDDAETLSDGTKVIRNEPYHTVEISKQSSYNSAVLSGAEFRLTGTSDYGTPYDKTTTSGENGLAKFTGLEAGTYIIQETKSPKDYFLDSTKHIVKVNRDDTYTIDGLKKNDSKYYRMDNKPEEKGKIVVKKKWKDNKTNDERPVPTIHITTDVNRVPSYTVWRNNKDSKTGPFYYVDHNYQAKTEHVRYADITSVDQVPENAVRLDKNYDDKNVKYKIWGWLTSYGVMFYWTNAQTTRLTNRSNRLFYKMQRVESIDLSKIDTSEMTDMSHMFDGCYLPSCDLSNPSLDASKLDTSNVTNMSYMFSSCTAESLDLSNLDTSKVTNMEGMFSGCERLESLNTSKWNTSSVTNMNYMFKNCHVLASLDASDWITSNVTNMSGMFNGCSDLTSLDLSNLDTSKVTDMSYMFNDCKSLASLDLSKLDTQNVTNISHMFDGCSSLTSLDLSKLDTSKVVNMSYMFKGCSKLTSLVSKLDTQNTTNMSCMFEYCYDLKSLDVSNWITSNVTDMSSMFLDCTSLTSLDVSNWITSNVTNMSCMFQGCSSLAPLDLSNWNTSKVTDMSYMFEYCHGLISFDVSKWDTSKVTDMGGMFSGCDMASIDVSNWNTSNATNMSDMFHYCDSLTSLDVSKWDTSKVTSMSSMFRKCSSLTSLNLSNWNTSKVTDMSYMFGGFYDFQYNKAVGCSSLTSLDLSSFDTSNVKYMSSMFYGCSSMTNIYVSSRWNTDKVTSSYDMFSYCSKLPNYSSSSTDKAHANYDAGGYLTYKAVPTAKVNISNISFASRLVSMILSRLAVPAYAADSASYVSTDKEHCKITKDGDTWTYEFSVVDDSAKYYVYEDNVEGYTSSNDVSSYGVVTKDEPLTITNTADDLPKEPKPASLSLLKTADGKQLTDRPVEKYSHTSNIDDTGKADRMYRDNLSTNDIVTIPGASKLHVKLYCSTETQYCDWACVWAGSHPDYKADENYSLSRLGTTSGKICDGYKTSMSDITPIEGDIDGDSVTFGFRSDYSEAYYGYYAVVTGNDADGNAIKAKVPSDTDIADIPSSFSDMAYMFDITLKNSDSSKLSGTKIFGNTVFTDGKAQVGVKAGEAKTFSGLPGGTTYTITEKKYDDFYTESENASGTLDAGDNAKAKFTNHYQKPKTPDTPKEYSGFTLKKELTGYYDKNKHKDQNFTFDVSFKKLDPNTEYTLSNGTKFTSDADGYGYVQTRLSDNGSVTFTSLPVGALYKVTEEGGDWSSAYRITNSTDNGDIAQSTGSAEKNESLSTEWETADSGEGITVTYTNTVKKYQNLVLKKAVTGGEAPDKFRFKIDFANLYETVRSDAGTIVPDDDGTASVDVYLNAGDKIVFKNIPVTAKYRFTEKANAGKASYIIRTDAPDGVAGGHFENSAAGNTEAMKDLSTATERVDEGENATVTFLNDMPQSASITLKKQVAGAFANRSKFFRFTVSLTGADKKQSYLIDLTNGSSEHDGKKNPMFITTDENGHGSADVWLKHNDEIVLKNLPLDAKYSIAEEKTEEYETTIKANGSDVGGISDRSVQPDNIVFINRSEGILPTGIAEHRNAIALACVAIILAVCSAFILLKRKRKMK